jgi:predicted RNA-binding Zn-ribbon protein involved in translation (DUF1610 family)
MLVWVFAVTLGLLIYWLLSFVVNDIATWPGPDYQQIEQQMLDPDLAQEERTIATELEDVQRQIAERQGRQGLLRDSTQNSERTMNQLLEFHRLSLEKNVEPTAAEQQSLAEAEQLFLENQKQYQQLNTESVQLNETLSDLQRRQRTLAETLQQARIPIQREFERLWQWHQFKLAAAKLTALLPLTLIAGWLFLKARHGTYAPLIYAFGIALAIKVTVVMHDHFPARYFKYILILTGLAIVTRILVYLLRMIAHPGRDYLLKQYREAYERFFCPICGYPIRRGPLKHVFWSRSSIKKLHFPPQPQSQPDEPYTCPACGTRLFENCESCGKVRHSLLPVCTDCGHEKPPVEA